jgi:hypothetical protein
MAEIWVGYPNAPLQIHDQATMSKLSFRGLPLVRTVGARLPTTGVCTLVVPELTKSTFLLRIFKILGAEGETQLGIPIGQGI